MTETTTIQHAHVNFDLAGFRFLVEDKAERVYEGVAIRQGVYIPGVGNPLRLRVRMRAEVLRAIAPSGKGKKVDIEHLQDMENEVGYIRDSYYAPDKLGIRQQLGLQPTRPRFTDAIGFVEGRLQAGLVPELSIELENMVLVAADPRDKAFFDLDLVGATIAGVALVSKGACGSRDGCGIGLSFAEDLNANTNPSNPIDPVTPFRDSSMPCDANCVTKHAELIAAKAKAEEDKLAAFKARDEALAAQKGVEQKLGEATTTSTSLKTELEATKTQLKERDGVIQGYKDAEKTALLEALQLHAPKTADLKQVLGLEAKQDLKEAPIPVIEVALKAFKSHGSKPAAPDGGGRRTIPTARDGSPFDAQKFLDAKREAMGLSAPDAQGNPKPTKALPRALQKNTAALMGSPSVKGVN